MFIFWEPSGPSGARMCTNTEVGSALPSAKPSLPRGLLKGGTLKRPQKRQCFFKKKFHIQASRTLRKVDARHKRLWNGIGRAERPPRPPGYGIPTHLPTPKLFMNLNFLAEAYLRRTREHGIKVKKTRARMHKAPSCRTVNTH